MTQTDEEILKEYQKQREHSAGYGRQGGRGTLYRPKGNSIRHGVAHILELMSLARQSERERVYRESGMYKVEQQAFEKGKTAGREEALNELTKRKIGGSVSKPIVGSPIPDTDKMLKRIAELEKQVAELKEHMGFIWTENKELRYRQQAWKTNNTRLREAL